MKGQVCSVECYGNGICLTRMRVAEQYGSQSKNLTLKTLRTIIEDADVPTGLGIMPAYVRKVFKGVSSGYTLITDYVWACSTELDYFYFPYEPASKCLEDICNILNALGDKVHWIVTPDKELLLAPIGDHNKFGKDSGYLISSKWPTYFRDEGYPIQVKQNMVSNQFKKHEVEANYLIINGLFSFPRYEWLTEGNPNKWDYNYGSAPANSTGVECKVGTYGLKKASPDMNHEMWYPMTGLMDINMTKIGTKKKPAHIKFWIYKNDQVTDMYLRLYTGPIVGGQYYEYHLNSLVPIGVWTFIDLAVGSDDTKDVWVNHNYATWLSIDKIYFKIESTAASYIIIDNLSIEGFLQVRVHKSILYGKTKTKLITESLMPAEAFLETDPLILLMKAELSRCSAEPLTGEVCIPFDWRALAGQIVYIKAEETEIGFNIDDPMRITEVRHAYSSNGGVVTFLKVTDDLTNSYTKSLFESYNQLVKATSPDFQDRTRAAQSSGEVDLDQYVWDVEV